MHLKLECDILLSTFAFKFNLHRYTAESEEVAALRRTTQIQADIFKRVNQPPGSEMQQRFGGLLNSEFDKYVETADKSSSSIVPGRDVLTQVVSASSAGACTRPLSSST
jgi:hypothetical protein